MTRRFWVRWGLLLAACAAGALLAAASEHLILRNNGDFRRVSEFMLDDVTRELNVRAPLRIDFARPEEPTAAALTFLLFGAAQRPFSSHYELAVSSLAGKAAVLAGLALLAAALAGRGRPLQQALLFAGLALAAFAAHNSAMLKSFYAEWLFFVGIGPLYAGLAGRRGAWTVVGAALCGLAKVQYFYVPLLALACRKAAPGALPGRAEVAALLAVQLLCLVPLAANPHAHLHRYHATYFGSYLLLSTPQLRKLGLTDRDLGCVGVDAWGHRVSADGTRARPGHITCVTDRRRGWSDVLAPYRLDPSLLWRLPLWARPHFTIDAFHVDRDARFLGVLPRPPARGQALLLALSSWRERWITPIAPALLLGCLALGAGLRRRSRVAPILAFVPLFFASQVAVSLLGEGIRDLSKHLWGAQLALDLSLPLLAWGLWRVARRPRRSSGSSLSQ